MAKNMESLVVNDARILFRNFAGKEGKFNPAGNRNFCLVIDDTKVAKDLEEDGWNVKYLTPRDPGEEPKPYLSVKVNYSQNPPKIYMMSGKFMDASGKVRFRNHTLMDEDTIASLDYAEIENVDIVVNPYQWEVNGRTGVKAYVKTMYVTIADDPFADKYYPEDDEIPFN